MTVTVALALVALGFLLALVRVLRGPTVADRAVGADVAFSAVIAAVALVSLRAGTEEFLDIVLIGTLLGFLSTIALSVLVRRSGS